MRRRDLLTVCLLGSVALYSWQRLTPPSADSGKATIDEAVLSGFSPWHGPVGLARAAEQSTEDEGARVLGASTDDRPYSLFPPEEYHGPALTYSLEEMLAKLGVTVAPEDIVSAFPDPRFGIGSQITIYRATPVELTDWGKKKVYRTWQRTVEDFLAEQAIELGDNDTLSAAPTAELELANNTAKLTITRVAITEVKVKEKIAFKKIEKEDPEMLRGQVKVTPGSNGERIKTFQVRRENGVEVSRKLLNNEVIKEPTDEIRIVGTKVLIGETYTGRASWFKYDSTKVASDHFERGTQLRITNLDNGKVIFVKNDGCICDDNGYLVDLHPDHFTALGGKLTDGVMKRIKVDEVLN